MTSFSKRLSKAALVAVMLTSVSYAALAGEPRNLDLKKAVETGMITNPQYAIVANDRRAVDEELNQAKARYQPSVDFLGESGWEHTNRGTIDHENLWRNNAALTLTQTVYDGNGRASEVKRQKNRIESTASRVHETAEFVGFDIVESYLEVLRQRDILDIARKNVTDHIDLLSMIEQGANAGTITQGDVEQAKARLAAARATESSVRRDLRDAETTFLKTVGDLPGELEFPTPPTTEVGADVDEAVRLALINSPTLGIFEADIKVAQAEKEGTGSTLYPQLDFQLQGREGHDLDGVEGSDSEASALAIMRWNLYRGGADKARVREFTYREALAKERRANAARGVEQDVRNTWADMVSAGERAKEFKDQAAANEQVVTVYKDQFNLDRRTLLDVLDSQNELFVSKSSYINALYTELQAKYRLLAIKGALLSFLNVPKPIETVTQTQ